MAHSRSASPAVTVIIATYNSSATLQLTLESLLNQDAGDFEAWVIGDACTDNSADVVQSFGDPRLHWKNLTQNSGSQAAPNNEGLRLARGRHIAFLGHDDLWLPNHLSSLLRFIEETKADFVHSLCALIGPDGVRECVGPLRTDHDYEWYGPPPSSWLHRRDVTDTCGLWADPTQIAWGVDCDYARRVFLSGKTMAFFPGLTVLKFPSWWCRTYAGVGEPPQLRYWRALQADPRALERQVLVDLSINFARLRRQPVVALLSTAFRGVLRHMRQAAGNRGPLGRLLRWRFGRQRQHLRRLRGLPDLRRHDVAREAGPRGERPRSLR